MEKDVLEAESTLEVSVSSLIQLLAAPKVDKSRAAALLSAALSQLRFYRFLLLTDPSVRRDDIPNHEQQATDFARILEKLAASISVLPDQEIASSATDLGVADFAHVTDDDTASAAGAGLRRRCGAATAPTEASSSAGAGGHASSSSISAASVPCSRPLPASGKPAAGRAAALGAAGSSSASANAAPRDAAAESLLRTRSMLVEEIDKMGALGGQLTADAQAMAQAGEVHSALAGEVEEARARIRRIKAANARDSRVILLAFLFFLAVAGYTVLPRLLWLVGIDLKALVFGPR